MKVTVWVRHEWSRSGACDIEVISDKEYAENRQANIDNLFHDDDAFSEWLDDVCTVYQMWNMTPEQKTEVMEDWKNCCMETVDTNSEWNSYEVEV